MGMKEENILRYREDEYMCVCVYKIKLSSACFMKLLCVLILVLDPQKKAREV